MACIGLLLLLASVYGKYADAQVSPVQGSVWPSEASAPRRSVLVDVVKEDEQQANAEHGTFELTAEQLDRWVFNNAGGDALQSYQTLINIEIEQIDAICSLSPKQKRMLALAGAGELQHIRDSLAPLHAQYAGRVIAQADINEIFQEIQPFREMVKRKVLNPDSLVCKLLQTTLDEEQSKRWAGWLLDRTRIRQRGQIASAVAAIERKVPLIQSQRQALIQLLEAEVLPALRDSDVRNMGIETSTAVLSHMNAMAPEAFQTFLDDAQWDAMQSVFAPHRGRLRLLQQRGGGMM
jgi:hypothetical protein